MTNQFELNAELRSDQGKGASRRLRRGGHVPAILYGGERPPVALTLVENEILNHLEHEAFYSQVLTLKAGDVTQPAILRDVQRHPYKRQVLHLDFMRVDMEKEIRVHVPLHFINEDTSKGVKAGGRVAHNITEVDVVCLPKHLPEFIEVDLAEVELGAIVHLSDLVLPEGVALVGLQADPVQDLAVGSIQLPKASTEPEEGEESGEGGEVAE
jgi:large subunit ribosomal protein L25